MVVGFSLPEGLAGAPQDLVGGSGRKALERLLELAGRDSGRQQHVDMVRHHHPGMQFIVLQVLLPEAEGIDHDLGDVVSTQPSRAVTGLIQVVIDTDEGLSAGEAVRGEVAVRRQRAVEPLSEK